MYDSIISPEALRNLLAGSSPPLVIACHHDLADPEAGRRRWQKEKIADAAFLHLDEDMSGPILPGQTGRHPLPTKKAFTQKAQAIGYSGPQQQIIVYDAKGGGIAARAWWLFKWIGHRKVAVLDGGLLAFQALEAEPSTGGSNASAATPDEHTTHASLAKIKIEPAVQHLEHIQRIVRTGNRLLIDSRTAPRYRGEEEPIDPVAGHIPGAINLPWPENLDESGCFKSREALKKRFAPLRNKASDNVFYCGSGVTACHNILAYYHAFGEMPTLYPGSWSEFLLTI